jgi:glyceraldehyde-3-phosphate dehydrogenase/erythrose-4-phosphate dehydrogenase
MANIAINGLGRAGRAALKILEQADGAEVVAVNDLVLPDNLACLLRYDTVHGRWDKTLMSAPARTETVATVVHGVNHAPPDERVTSHLSQVEP